MIEPNYQELKDKDIPKVSNNGVHVKIIAGESMGVKSPVYTRTPTLYLDFKLDKDAIHTQQIKNEWNAIIGCFNLYIKNIITYFLKVLFI